MSIFKGNAAIESFLNLVVDQGLQPNEVDVEGIVEITNPPYSSPEYVAPFVNQLRNALLAVGFERFGDRFEFVFQNHELEAEIRHVGADNETGPPIEVKFRFLTPKEVPTLPALPDDEEDT